MDGFGNTGRFFGIDFNIKTRSSKGSFSSVDYKIPMLNDQ